MKRPTFLLVGLASISVLSAATVVHEIGTLNDQAQDESKGFGIGDFTTADAVYTFSNQVVDGEIFDYTITFAAGAGTTDVGTGNGGLVDVGSGVSFFQHDDVISVTVNVTGNTNVVFDGFVNFGLNFVAAGDGFNIEGVDYVRGTATNGDSDPRHGIAITGGIIAQNSVDVTFIAAGGAGTDAGVLRGVAYQFSAIPEPSTSVLLGGLLVGMIGLRRRG